jgi:ATP synthase protein I
MSEDPNDNEAELEARLAKLSAALRARDAREEAERAPRSASKAGAFARAISAGLNVFSEFVGAVIVGGVIGWAIDAWAGTKPWGLVLFMALGTAAGFWNIYRMAARQASAGDKATGGET